MTPVYRWVATHVRYLAALRLYLTLDSSTLKSRQAGFSAFWQQSALADSFLCGAAVYAPSFVPSIAGKHAVTGNMGDCATGKVLAT